MTECIKMADRSIGEGSPLFIIAEAGLNHNGDMELAHSLIDMAALCGADCVKFQKRTVSRLAVGEVLDQNDDRFPSFGKTYREIREHLELTWEQMQNFKSHCESKGLHFLCTAFDEEAADGLIELGVSAMKLASHSLTNLPLVEHVAKQGLPTFLSTGMATEAEIDQAVRLFHNHRTQLVLNHCVSAYPQPVDESNLSMIPFLKARYQVPVGYSGHEHGIHISLAAAALGASAVERHVTLDKRLEGFDHAISMEPDEFFRLCRGLREIESAVGSTSKTVSEKEWITRRKYHVSIASARKIRRGTVIERDMLALKNPGTGLPSVKLEEVVGRKSLIDIPFDVLIQEDMLSQE